MESKTISIRMSSLEYEALQERAQKERIKPGELLLSGYRMYQEQAFLTAAIEKLFTECEARLLKKTNQILHQYAYIDEDDMTVKNEKPR